MEPVFCRGHLPGLSSTSSEQEKGSASLNTVSLPFSSHMQAGLYMNHISQTVANLCINVVMPQFIDNVGCGRDVVRLGRAILPPEFQLGK